MTGLVDLIDSYGEAIEADLHAEYQLDLLDWFRGRHPWPKLIRLVRQLPATSRYQEALADDEELAERVIARDGLPDRGKPPRPRVSEFTPEVAVGLRILDRLEELRAAMTNGKTRAPALRPSTAFERIRARVEEAEDEAVHASLVARLTPHRVDRGG